MTNKPTDAEIIKAFEHCVNTERGYKCRKCEYVTGCKTQLMREALDLINRLKAENEDLEIKLKHFAEFLAEADKKNEALISAQKTLQKHIEKQNAEIERLSHEIYVLKSENSFLLKSKGNLKMNKEVKHEIKQSILEVIKEYLEE